MLTISGRYPSGGDLPRVLESIDGWGAANAAACVFDDQGVIADHGPTDRSFPTASITKLSTALTILVAIEEETVHLDTAVGPPGSTVRHLLCHAGGYAFDTFDVLASPGTRRIYSNTGYEILADHLVEQSGMGFDEYMTEAVIAPLSMADTALVGSPAAGLRSTAADLVRLGFELLKPTLVSSATLEGAISPQFPGLPGVVPGWGSFDPCPWGLGPELKGSKAPHWMGASAPPATFGHFGGSGTLMWIDPEQRIGCVALTDRTFGDWALDVWPDFSDGVRRALG